MTLQEYRTKCDRLLVNYEYARQRVKEEKATLAKATARIKEVAEAQEVLQIVAEQVQNQAHKRIASVVSRCLEAVFPTPYAFKIIFDRKRGKTEARLVFVRDEHEIDPTTAAGGGVLDVAALALRLAAMMLSTPKVRRFVCMDEPFKWLSPELRERVPELLETLAEEMNLQVLIVSNLPEIATGKIVRIK